MTEAEIQATLVLRLRKARRKAREAAVAELVALLRDFKGCPLRGGPLSEVSGVAWVGVNESAIPYLRKRIRSLGYTEIVYLVRESDKIDNIKGNYKKAKWKRRDIVLLPIYSEFDAEMRKNAPDKRGFLLECGDGVIRRITGYRGSYGDFEHRGLPVEDSRLLVNVVFSPNLGRLLDPFAGAGGIVIEAKKAGWETWSIDIDPSLRHGLAELADHHLVANSNKLPLDNAFIDAIATEPPYHSDAYKVVTKAVFEFYRVLKPGGRLTILAAEEQAKMIQKAADSVGFDLDISTPINRKGTDVVCLCWKR